MSKQSHLPNRRRFLAGTSMAALGGLNIITTTKSAAQQQSSGVFVGEGDHRYEVFHNWAKLPDSYTWQTTHNVAVDSKGMVYVIHEGRADQTDHPSIFVFDQNGECKVAFGEQFQGGGHGLEIRDENGEEFLYVTGYQHLKMFQKLTTKGKVIWEKRAPMESEMYAEGEAENPEKVWGRDRFMPTNFAFLPDGGFFLADGYGAHTIHRYDAEGNWVSKIGKTGKADGEFNLPHGLWIDYREANSPKLVVADRGNGRLQWFSLGGKHLETMDGFILPANVDRFEDTLLVPDLSARITLLDKDNQMIHLGEDEEWRKQVLKDGKAMRKNPAGWVDGKFVHPHDACFDAEGNIYVAEWVNTGRITKLKKV